MSITLDFKQATELLEFFGGGPGLVTVALGGDLVHPSGALVVYCTDYPEEGFVDLGVTDEDARPDDPPPIDMVLFCPACGMQHIDRAEFHFDDRANRVIYDWKNPPHRSHLCHGCGHTWRPADVPTNGVAAVKTKGKNDSPPTPAQAHHLTKDLHPNTAHLVIRFAEALAEKLRKAELKYGYSDGWEANDWMDECRAKLMQHIAKGDPLDVAAYCAFLWHHGESIAPVAEQQGEQEPVLWVLTYNGEITRNIFRSEEIARSEKEKLDKNHPEDMRTVMPLYTHPSPSLAELRAKVETMPGQPHQEDRFISLNDVLAEIDRLGGKI